MFVAMPVKRLKVVYLPQQSNHMTNSCPKIGQGTDGGRYIVKTKGVPLRINNQPPLLGAHFWVDSGNKRFANGAKHTCRLAIAFVISA